jgi:Ca2+/Na+ antiporter
VHSGVYYLLGGMAALFTGSLLLSNLLPNLVQNPHNADEEPIGVRALAFFFPIAAASLVALFLGSPDVAVGIVFGTSVGALTSVIGFTALAAPIAAGPRHWTRLWPFALAASLIVFIAGFRGVFQWHDAVALLTEGAVIFGLVFDPTETAGKSSGNITFDALDSPLPQSSTLNYAAARPGERPQIDWQRQALAACELVLIAALLWVAALAATRGAVRTGALLRAISPSALAGSLISLALVLPMTWGAWRRAESGRSWSPVSTQVCVVLLNLCVLLPLLILIPYAAAKVPQLSRFAGDALAYGEGLPRLLLYPAPMWRIDNVVMIIASALLLPVSLGRWNLGREEGMVLIAGYFFYLTATLLSG